MKPKERVLRVINGDEADRPPIFTTLTPQTAKKLSDHFNLPYEEPLDSLLSTRISHMDLLTHMGNDCVGIAACSPKNAPTRTLGDGRIVNEWGMIFRDIGLYNEFDDFPLKNASTVDDIKNYSFPDPFAEGRFDAAVKAVEKYGEDYAIVGDLETSFWETSWYLAGLEKLMIDMMMETQYVNALFDKVMEINTEIGKKLVELGSDIIWAGDDFGSQQGMIMDPDTWRKYFKPRIKIMFEEFRKVNPDIKIAWHSCGSIVPVIGDFIDVGLDILNPLQPQAAGMDPENLTSKFGKDLVYFGGIDIQDLLPNSTPEKIKSEVKRIAGIYGRKSGYILAPAHNIQDDTPVENIIAMFEAAMELAD